MKSDKVNSSGLVTDIASSIRDNLKGEMREDADHIIDELNAEIVQFTKLVIQKVETDF